jgi:hypothetical protein
MFVMRGGGRGRSSQAAAEIVMTVAAATSQGQPRRPGLTTVTGSLAPLAAAVCSRSRSTNRSFAD